ncbi:MAG: YitT family protein [Clostridia bacterium]|nr:YitT family protein [Clostridia bacterium]
MEEKETMQPSRAGKMENVFFRWAKIILFTMLSSFLLAFAAYSLIAPNDFTIGGVTGIAILTNVLSDGKIPQSVIIFGLNFPLIACAFAFVKKKFALLTLANIVLQTVWMIILENAFPDFSIQFVSNGEKIFAAIASGLCIGTAIALAFKVGGSTGGIDVLAVIIQRKVGATSIAWMIFLLNIIVIGASFFVFYEKADPIAYNLLPIMMSAFESYVESKTNDSMTNGFQSAIEFRIITDKPEEMSEALMKELSRGITELPAKGMYTKHEHSMLVCIINRRQVATLKRVMKRVDPDSFAVMAHVSQVLGLGFYQSEM